MCKRMHLLLLMAWLCAMGSPVAAQDYYGREPDVQPLDRILPTLRSEHPGRFYDAEGPFPDPNGGYHYRIKWLTPQGRVIWFDADARSGHVEGVARGDWRARGPEAVGPAGDERFGGYGRRPYGGRNFGRPAGGRWRGH